MPTVLSLSQARWYRLPPTAHKGSALFWHLLIATL